MNSLYFITALLISTVAAHFKVYTPPFRPGTGKPELISPCGNIPLGNRTDFPIVGGFVNGNYGHNGTGHISAVISATDPPANQFQKYFVNTRGINATFNAGNFSEAVDFSNVPGVADGAPVTVQMVLYDGNITFHLCGDFTLRGYVAGGAAPAETYKPVNSYAAAPVAQTNLYSNAYAIPAVTGVLALFASLLF